MSGMKIDKEKTEPAVGISTAVMAACLVYGIHPLTVGSVGWVAARFDVMSVTFGLGGMYMWLRRETGDDRPRTLIVSIVLLLLSILSKEQGVVYAASCAGTSLVGALKSPRKRRSGIIGAGLIAAVAVMYLTYRTMVFNGLGGYLEARHGLSIKPPLYYFLAVLFPYRNVMGGSRISVTFIIAAFLIILMTAVLWKKYTTGIKQVNSIIVPAAAFLFVFGLATNAPNPGLTLERILGHAESRFALNAVAGFALLIGVAFRFLSHRQKSAGILLVVLTLWSITAAWRTDVQIQAWEAAGEKARTIVEETVRLAPDPPAGSKILFFDIPRNNDQWAYIFGIGLKEALMLRYGRSDITFIRYPTRDDLRAARPDRDYVLAYNKTTGHLERLRAKKQDTSQ